MAGSGAGVATVPPSLGLSAERDHLIADRQLRVPRDAIAAVTLSSAGQPCGWRARRPPPRRSIPAVSNSSGIYDLPLLKGASDPTYAPNAPSRPRRNYLILNTSRRVT